MAPVAFRMIHKPSCKPIRYLKGVETERGLEKIPEEEIINGYEHAKGHHVLINPEEIDSLEPEEIDSLELEAKHTIDMKTFCRPRRAILKDWLFRVGNRGRQVLELI